MKKQTSIYPISLPLLYINSITITSSHVRGWHRKSYDRSHSFATEYEQSECINIGLSTHDSKESTKNDVYGSYNTNSQSQYGISTSYDYSLHVPYGSSYVQTAAARSSVSSQFLISLTSCQLQC